MRETKRFEIGTLRDGNFEADTISNDPAVTSFATLDEATAAIAEVIRQAVSMWGEPMEDGAIKDTETSRIVWRQAGMKTWMVADDSGCRMKIEAATAREAAEEYVYGAEWGEIEETDWVTVGVFPEDDPEAFERIKITLDPEEPKCLPGKEHDWHSPFAIVGGIKENPGVWGHGGGVTIDEVCMLCGCAKTTDTWAQDRSDGEQGLESVRYQPGKYDVNQIKAAETEE